MSKPVKGIVLAMIDVLARREDIQKGVLQFMLGKVEANGEFTDVYDNINVDNFVYEDPRSAELLIRAVVEELKKKV